MNKSDHTVWITNCPCVLSRRVYHGSEIRTYERKISRVMLAKRRSGNITKYVGIHSVVFDLQMTPDYQRRARSPLTSRRRRRRGEFLSRVYRRERDPTASYRFHRKGNLARSPSVPLINMPRKRRSARRERERLISHRVKEGRTKRFLWLTI